MSLKLYHEFRDTVRVLGAPTHHIHRLSPRHVVFPTFGSLRSDVCVVKWRLKFALNVQRDVTSDRCALTLTSLANFERY